MSDEKLAILRQSHTLHPHPEGVRDPLFLSGSPFFDPRDLVQVKYELLRRVHIDGYSVTQATSLFALSRPTFYTAQAGWDRWFASTANWTSSCPQTHRGDSRATAPSGEDDVSFPISRVATGAASPHGASTQH